MMAWAKFKLSLYIVLRTSLCSAIIGLLAGATNAVFLRSLEWVTEIRTVQMIWFLPIGGFIVGWFYFKFGQAFERGPKLVVEQIQNPRQHISFLMAPFVFIGTLVTHFFGGSAGREGTAVQIGAAFSDLIVRVFRIGQKERRILLMAGAGAGFGSAVGAPWAGIVFGLELLKEFKPKCLALPSCVVASWVAYKASVFLGAPHIEWPKILIPVFNLKIFFKVAVASIFFGLAANAYLGLSLQVEKTIKRIISYPPLRPFIIGLIIVIIFYIEGTYRYAGLGLSYIQEAFLSPAMFKDPALKIFFTSLTVGSGFKGGEFIPLVFVGASLGSALSLFIPLVFQFMAAIGVSAVFAGASKMPIACSIMAAEFFGLEIAPYALLACLISAQVSGRRSIYQDEI